VYNSLNNFFLLASLADYLYLHYYARKQLLLRHRNSARLSVRHTGGSVKNGASQNHQIFTIGCLGDSSFRKRKAFPQIRRESPRTRVLNERGWAKIATYGQ